jgi:threonine dehydratase
VPLAAVMTNKERFKGRKVGLILTGGNVDLEQLPFKK